MLIVLSIFLAFILSITGVLLVNSSGKTGLFTDEKGKPLTGSVSEKIYVTINGLEQGMFIRGKNSENPVLLFLHGGPGMPEYAISRQYPLVLEDYFTVCWWDQRGAGLSYYPEMNPDLLTFDQLIADVLEVTCYLRKRFKQQKIYLMAHSGGTFIGIQAASKAPELYHAYIATAQISNRSLGQTGCHRSYRHNSPIGGSGILSAWHIRLYCLLYPGKRIF